ncbi:Fibroblast growth factor receptor 1, partial [Paramuricea clavata]
MVFVAVNAAAAVVDVVVLDVAIVLAVVVALLNILSFYGTNQCTKDKLEVADNSGFDFKCGASPGSPDTYNDGDVSFNFTTDGSGSGSGFILTYKLVDKPASIPSSPRNARVIVEGNALIVSWLPPEYPQGEIKHYIVSWRRIKIQAVSIVGFGNSSDPVLAETQAIQVEPSDDESLNGGPSAGAVIGAILFVILVSIVLFILRRKILKRRHNESVREFHSSRLEKQNNVDALQPAPKKPESQPNATAQADQSENLSYVELLMDWEITPDSLKVLETTLGKGKFGIVKQGLLTTGESEPEVVAVKMLK